MNLVKYLLVGFSVLSISFLGVAFNGRNIILTFISIEMMLLSINYIFAVYSVFLDDILGQFFALLVLTVAAAESAIGLAILVIYYRVRGTISIELINLMKG